MQSVMIPFPKSLAPLSAAVVAAAIIGLLVPFELYQKVLMGLLLIAVGIIGFLYQARCPLLGLVALVLTAALLPLERGDPTQGTVISSSLPLAVFVCGTWILRTILVRQTTVLESSPVVWASVLFVFVSCVSFVGGQGPWFEAAGAPLRAQLGALGMIVTSIGLFMMVGHEIKEICHLEWLTFLFLASAAIACVVQMLPFLDSLSAVTIRPASIGSGFWTWLVAMGLSQAIINKRLRFSVRMALILLTALTLFHGFVQRSSWVSGWMPPVFAAAVILVFCMPRLTLLLMCGLAPIALVAGSRVLEFVADSEQYSLMTRVEAWRVLESVVSVSPLIGLGPANYYHYTELFPTLGWYVKFSSHNNYIDLIAQTGLIGFFVFLWLAFEILRLNKRLLWLTSSSDFTGAYVVGALGGLLGTLLSGLLGDWIIPFVYNTGLTAFRSSLLFWMFAGGLLALKRMHTSPYPDGASAYQLNPPVTTTVNP